MIPILTSLVVLLGLFSSFAVIVLGAWKSYDAAELSQRGAARMAELAVVVRGSLWVDADGVPRSPLGEVGADGRQHLPALVAGDDASPWGARYGWCPIAIPPAPGSSPPAEVPGTVAAGPSGAYAVTTVAASRLGSPPLSYVVSSAQTGPTPDAANGVVGYILSPPPYGTTLPDCSDVTTRAGFPVIVPARGPAGSVVEVSARGSVLSAVPSLPAIASDQRVTVAPVASGDGGGEDASNPMALGDAVRLWRETLPRATVFSLLPGRYPIGGADVDFRSREPGRAVRLVSATPGAAVIAASSGSARVELAGDVVLDGVSTDVGTSVVAERGARVSLRSASISNLDLEGGGVVAGPDSAFGTVTLGSGTLRTTGAPFDAGQAGAAPATGSVQATALVVGEGTLEVDGLSFGPSATVTWTGRGGVDLLAGGSVAGSSATSVAATASCAAADATGLVACRADCDPVHPRITYPTCDGDGAPVTGTSLVRASTGVESQVCMFRPLAFVSRTVLTPAPAGQPSSYGTTTAVDLDAGAAAPATSVAATCSMTR